MRPAPLLSAILSLLAITTASFAQHLNIWNIDTKDFPTVRAQFHLFDAQGNLIRGLTPSDIEVREDGVLRTVRSVTCPPEKPKPILSVAMSIDISGSMGGGLDGPPPVELGKSTARELARLIDLPPSEMALQLCDHRARFQLDFTTNRERFLRAIEPAKAVGGNDFVEHLLNPNAGLLNIAKAGRFRRVAVLYTDAWWEPLTGDELQRCKDTCSRYGIRFYAVIYSRPEASPNGIKNSLRQLAEATGGQMFDGVTSEEGAKRIALDLQADALVGEPCELVWESGKRCDRSVIDLEVRVPSIPISVRTTYAIPTQGLVDLEVSPERVSFLGSKTEQSVTLTARGDAITIQQILPDNIYFEVSDYGGSPPPFTIPDGGTRTITVRYTKPGDTIFAFGAIAVVTGSCDKAIYAVGGNPRGPVRGNVLTVTHPNGGEVFPVGIDTVITWKGISPTKTVTLEYSTDAGATWNPIARDATGLRYGWRVPNTPSLQCLVRARESIDSSMVDELSELAVVLPGHVGAALYGAWSPDGTRVATMSREDKAVQFWDPTTGTPLSGKLTGHVSQWDGMLLWSADSRRLLSTWRDWDCLMWDADAGALLRRLPQNPGGTDVFNRVAWSPDESRILGSGFRSVVIWDGATGGIVNALEGIGSAGAFWNDDGSTVLILNRDGAVERWDPATNARTFLTAGFAPSGQLLNVVSVDAHRATGRIAVGTSEGWVVVVNTKSGTTRTLIDAPRAWVTHVAFSPDGERLTACFDDGRIIIYNVVTGDDVVVTIGRSSGAHFTAWSPRGDMVAVGGAENDIYVCDPSTGKILFTLRGHANYTNHVAWSPEGARLLSSSADGTARVWNLFVSNQSDISDSLWAIVKPLAAGIDVDMGQVVVGGLRDSMVTAFVRNNGTYVYPFEAISVLGPDAADFHVVSGNPPTMIPPGGRAAVEFRFTPTAVGFRSARLVIAGGGDTLQKLIYGVGVQPLLEVASTLVDFGTIAVLESKDTTVTATIRNIGAAPVTITGTSQLGPDMEQFEIVSGGGGFTLAPGEARTMSLRFNGKYVGRAAGSIGFEFNGPGSPAVMDLFGRALGGIVYVADDTARAGEHTSLALVINGASSKLKGAAGGQRFAARLRFNQTLLAPDDPAAPGAVAGGERTVSVDGVWTGADDTLARIPMIALLGDAESTPIEIISFEWLDDARRPLDVEVERKSGTFVLSDLCREGGTRLYDEKGVAAALRVLPNPAAERFELEYALAEDGEISIDLFDVAGARVRRILDGERSAGLYRMNISAGKLPSGAYILVLRTPTTVTTCRVEINR